MSPPWMPLYIADYLADTSHLGALESGAYLHLIMSYWRHGGLPSDDVALARIARMSKREWERSRETLQVFFHDGWKHKRVDFELKKFTQKSEARAESGSRGGNAKSLNSKKEALAKATILPDVCQTFATPFALASSSESERDTNVSLRDSVENSKTAKPEKHLIAQACLDFWQAYPKRDGSNPKTPALDKFQKLVKSGESPAEIIEGARRYAARFAKSGDDRKFVAQAVTWLNQRRWEDEQSSSTSPVASAAPARRELLETDGNYRGACASYAIEFGRRPPISNGRAFFPAEWLANYLTSDSRDDYVGSITSDTS